MHELSIAMNIVELVEEHIAAQPGRVTAVDVRIGCMAGIVPAALSFAWEPATHGTRLQGSALRIHWEEAAGYCSVCGCDRPPESAQSMRCAVCGAPILRLTCGRALDLTAIELVEEP